MHPIISEILSLYPTPDATTSEEQADRLGHLDLGELSENDLRRELSWLRTWNFVLASECHAEREQRVADELRLRHERRGRRA